MSKLVSMCFSFVWVNFLANNIVVFDFSFSFGQFELFLMKVLLGGSMEIEFEREIIAE